MPIVATAGWSIPRTVADRFPTEGSGLARYASVLPGVEINSTFYRRHKPSTFARWAEAVPAHFRFAVKLARHITHDRKLVEIEEPLRIFLDDIAPLGEKRGPLLCQLPPSLAFDAKVAEIALTAMLKADAGPIVVEPRHESWGGQDAVELLDRLAIGRVMADPPLVWTHLDFPRPPAYLRLHGTPKLYYSSYSDDDIAAFASRLAADSWCVFDNTASGAAIENALTMLDRLPS